MITIEEIDKDVSNCPKTVFDKYSIQIDLRKRGDSLREEIIKLVNVFGTINELASNALLLYEQAETRKEDVTSLAWSSLPSGMKVTQQRIQVKVIEVDFNGEKTTINDEIRRVALYKYISNRGKDKVKEIEKILDVGRSLLSWDKQEHGGYSK